MNRPRCDQCYFWDFAGMGTSGVNIGYCMRYPPSRNVSAKDEIGDHQAMTNADDWCGEWRQDSSPSILAVSIDELHVCGYMVRARRAFRILGIATIGDLVERKAGDFAAIQGCGQGTIRAIQKALAELDPSLSLKT